MSPNHGSVEGGVESEVITQVKRNTRERERENNGGVEG